MNNYVNLPNILKTEGLFCCWKYEDRDGKKTKVPYNPRSGNRGKSNDKTTFTDFDSAIDKSGSYDGIGFGIFDDFVAIDIDHCIENGNVNEKATDICNLVKTYTEISPSGTGLHLYGTAKGFKYDKDKYYINNQKAGIEVYAAGCTNKYLTLTGNKINNYAVEDLTDVLPILLDRYMRKPDSKSQNRQQLESSNINDSELIEKIRQSAQAEKFNTLWAGDISGYKSQNEADQALCDIFAFWTAGDFDRIDSLFRQSGLYRDKWNRNDYRSKTINNAIAGCTEFYQPEYENRIDKFVRESGLFREKNQTQADTNTAQKQKESPRTKLTVISAKELQSQQFEKLSHPVPGFIPIGLTILAAPPKSGKSWMMMDLCIKVARGEPFLCFPTQKTEVLYLDLEDEDSSGQERLNIVTGGEAAPDGFHFVFFKQGEIRFIGDGLTDQLNDLLEDHPGIGLIIVDTFGKIEGDRKREESAFKADYRMAGELKIFADQKKVAIVAITHTTKEVHVDDFLANISGTNGKIAAADAGIVISREKRTDKQAQLAIDGRRVKQSIHSIRFDDHTCKWVYEGFVDNSDPAVMEQMKNEQDYKNSSIRQAVIAIAANNEKWEGGSRQFIEKAVGYGIGIENTAKQVGGFICKNMGLFMKYDHIRVQKISNGTGANTYRITEFQDAPIEFDAVTGESLEG